MEAKQVAAIAVESVAKIVEDLKDRRGLKQEWEQIDAATQTEIQTKWIVFIMESLNETGSYFGT